MRLTIKGSASSGWYMPPKGTHTGSTHRAVGSGKAIVSRKPVPKRALGSSPVRSTKDIPANLKGSNGATIVTYEDGSKAIFKSTETMDIGEVGSEVLTYEFSESIGWDLVPETTVTEIGGEIGSLQRWVPDSQDGYEFRDTQGASKLYEMKRGRDYTRMAVMDRLLSNPDRHDGNFVVDKAGRAWAIDNGMAFSPSGGMASHQRWINRTIPTRTELAAFKGYSDAQKKDYADAYADIAKWSKTPTYRDYVDALRSTVGVGAVNRLEYTAGVVAERYG